MNIAALVSGGVDSSVIVPVLIEQGYEPHIFYIRISMEDEPGFMDCPSEEDIEITTYIARKYNCKFDVVSLHKEYWDTVVAYTIESVKKGLTPNPDVMCNLLIKFGSFEEKYGKDFDKIATGHYARVLHDKQGFHLRTAYDRWKDQTYFLSRITYHQLSKAMFPVGDIGKDEVRKMAETLQLPSANRPDSQGICFLGKINYNEFIRRYTGEKEGDIVELETGKKLGKHKGYWFHTIGQRRGLGLSQGPWFVVKKDPESNIIYVSNGYDPVSQYSSLIKTDDFLFINENDREKYPNGSEITFKVRHQPEFNEGILKTENGKVSVKPAEPVAGIAPGQFLAVYDREMEFCIGNGIMSEK